ncbi:MAG: hypothetical protein KDA63_16445 [Planctomycetales bacterium]|nr:hypothetical protein [Planctomycetales bacterium]
MRWFVLVFFVAILLSSAADTFARNLRVTRTPNVDGSYTFDVEISTTLEKSVLRLSIIGSLQQVDGGAVYESISPSPWVPSVLYTSDQRIAAALNPAYAAVQELDTVIDDTWWPGKVEWDFRPSTGSGSVDGTEEVYVEVTSFIGTFGGPLPGGYIPLAHIVAWGGPLNIEGQLLSDSDPVGRFRYSTVVPDTEVPEPTAALLAIFAAIATMTTRRRR